MTSIVPLPWRIPRRLAYIVSHSYPYSSNGYAVRTHGIASALVQHGCSVVAINRPGRPWDLPGFVPAADFRVHAEIEGVRYLFTRGPSRRGVSFEVWRQGAAVGIETTLRVFKPSAVLAASNWENALPALDAADRLGLPFWYEVRGFWELSRLSRQPEWEHSEEFRQSVAHETGVAQRAERVFTLNHYMREVLVARGVSASKISVIPNAVATVPSLQALPGTLRNRLGLTSPFVVGYVGSFTEYEGLDDLVRACAAARDQGTDVSLLLVGSSNPLGISDSPGECPISGSLRALAKELSFERFLRLTGRVAPETLAEYYAAIDLVVIPRKALAVTEIVSPIKPLEAAAYGKAILVSDVAPLRAFADDVGAVTFRKSNTEDLTDQICRLLQEPERRRYLGERARAWVTTQRTFLRVVGPIVNALAATCDMSGPAASSVGGASAPDTTGERKPLVVEPLTLAAPSKGLSPEEEAEFRARVAAVARADGESAVRSLLDKQVTGLPERQSATLHLKAAQVVLSEGLEDAALRLADSALARDSSLTSVRSAARVFYDAARLPRADELAQTLLRLNANPSESDRRLADEIQTRNKLAVWAAQPGADRRMQASRRRVLNALAFSLPYTSVGYATRSHGLAVGLRRAGWDIRPYTRPGFPYDLKPELEGQSLPTYDEIDGVRYGRILESARKGTSETSYLLQAVEHWERVIDHEQPEIVHAASNYVTALPALVAARRKGVPFVYEIRGFWEVTRSSRDSSFVTTPKYRFMKLFEAVVAQHADAVITITTAMREELAGYGVRPEKVAIAYNSVDAGRFTPRDRDDALAVRLGIPEGVPVIGYIGSIVDYEGLDDLVSACAALARAQHSFRLMIVGDGAELDNLRVQVAGLGLAEHVIMPGRVAHDEVEAYYSLIDIAPFPRKPWEVCEMVSPLKPFEAMALKKAVVASNTRALSEIVADRRTGLLFRKGDTRHLQDVLAMLLMDPNLRRELGESARQWIGRERTWDTAAAVCAQVYASLLSSSAPASNNLLQAA